MGFRYQAWRRIVPDQIKGLVLEKVVAQGTRPLKQKSFELALASW
jgi:hypothetical protein